MKPKPSRGPSPSWSATFAARLAELRPGTDSAFAAARGAEAFAAGWNGDPAQAADIWDALANADHDVSNAMPASGDEDA